MRKLFILIILFFNFFETFAFEAKISTSNNEVNINESFTLRIEIGFGQQEEFDLKEIKGIENFEIISTSQSQSSSTSISIINGNAETVSKYVNFINFVLTPKTEGKFVLGPVSIILGNESRETNSLEISVLGDKFIPSKDKGDEFINDDFNEKNIGKGLLNKYTLALIFLFILFVIYVATDRKRKMDNLEENDFKEEMQEVYPLISDFDFIQKLERIFKSKIERKYKINNILSKSYDEILDLLDDDNIEIKSIFDEFQKAKYSNILIDKKKLLLMVEKI